MWSFNITLDILTDRAELRVLDPENPPCRKLNYDLQSILIDENDFPRFR